MAENSKIEWTDHTFNAWIGCSKVHEGCTHCYAEEQMDKRWAKAKWRPAGTRTLTSEANWQQAATFVAHHSGIDASAWSGSPDDYRAAYRTAAARLHPDSPTGSDELFKKLQAAKEMLDRHHGL